MNFITGWVTNIVLFVLLASVMDMLLPSSAMQKYAKMTIGLLLIAVIMTPILKLVNTDFDGYLAQTAKNAGSTSGAELENLTETKKKEIQAGQDAYILEQMAVQLRADTEEELMEQYKAGIESIDFEVAEGERPSLETVRKIKLTIGRAEKKGGAVETVSKVEIDTSKPAEVNTEETGEIKRFLAGRWEMDEAIIEIAGKKGGTGLE